jgi:competence CoiA-like predicted nuclease
MLKNGDIKIKHLCHKTKTKCRGTGETIFHKMWKEHMFYRGALINVDNTYFEVENVYNEISLKTFFNMDWNIDIIADILLQTTGGYVVVEIYYKHKKDWLTLEPYYLYQ